MAPSFTRAPAGVWAGAGVVGLVVVGDRPRGTEEVSILGMYLAS